MLQFLFLFCLFIFAIKNMFFFSFRFFLQSFRFKKNPLYNRTTISLFTWLLHKKRKTKHKNGLNNFKIDKVV